MQHPHENYSRHRPHIFTDVERAVPEFNRLATNRLSGRGGFNFFCSFGG